MSSVGMFSLVAARTKKQALVGTLGILIALAGKSR